jgi:hypothetical protein
LIIIVVKQGCQSKTMWGCRSSCSPSCIKILQLTRHWWEIPRGGTPNNSTQNPFSRERNKSWHTIDKINDRNATHETEIRRPICQRSKRAWLPPLWIPNWRQVLKWMDSRLKPSWRREREWVVVVEWLLVECCLFHSMHSNTLFRFAKNDKNIVLRNCEYGFKS